MDWTSVSSVATAVATVALVVVTYQYVKLTSKLASEAKRQADLAQENVALSKLPYLLLSPHPEKKENGVTYARIVNFSTFSITVNGGWIEAESKGNEQHWGPSITIIGRHPENATGLIPPGGYVEREVPDQQNDVKPGFHVMRVLFSCPTFPNRTNLFEVPFVKYDDGIIGYQLYNVAYNFDLEPNSNKQPKQKVVFRPLD